MSDSAVDVIVTPVHTGFTVTSLERSVPFYQEVLGAELVKIQERDGSYMLTVFDYPEAHTKVAILKLPGSEHTLELVEWIKPAGRAPEGTAPEPFIWGTGHMAFHVSDIEPIQERAEAAGVEFFTKGGPADVTAGMNKGARCLYIRDPDRIPLEFIQPAPAVA